MSNPLVIKNLSHRYDTSPVFQNIDLDVKKGEWMALLGGSGCGKSTLLRIIAGFIKPQEGVIYIHGKNVSSLPPHKREVGLVFQDYALFPTQTVRQNIAFGRKKYAPTCMDLLSLVSLQGMENRFPSQLSGGQQQRVALIRALAAQPQMTTSSPSSHAFKK